MRIDRGQLRGAAADRRLRAGRLPGGGRGAPRAAGAAAGGGGGLGRAARSRRRSWNGRRASTFCWSGTGAAMAPPPAGLRRDAGAARGGGGGGGDHGDALGLPDLQRAARRGAAGRGGADAGLSALPRRGRADYKGAGFACPTTSEDNRHGFRTSRPSLSPRRAGRRRHVEGDARVPPRHPPQGLCRQRQQG